MNTSLADLIVYAYDMHAKQILNGPDWIDKDKYDISALPDHEGAPSHRQWQMMQKLLANRFQLAFHHEKRDLNVYILSVAKGGPKNLIKSDRTDADGFSVPTEQVPGGFTMRITNANMGDFASFALQQAVLDRPVLDQTGITGRYDFRLTWAQLGTEFGGDLPAPRPVGNPPPNLFAAIQEQLGLKLEAAKAPADVMVIDEAEKPSAN